MSIAGVHANRNNISWEAKDGVQHPNYFASAIHASTVYDGTSDGEGYVMKRSKVVDIDLQEQLYEHLKNLIPLPSIVQSEFVADNKAEFADFMLAGTMRFRHAHVDVTVPPRNSGNTRDVTDVPRNLLSLSPTRSECRAQCLYHRGDG